MAFAIHFLDVGTQEYGDALLCQLGDETVLIDGSHPGDQKSKPGYESIPAQLSRLIGKPEPVPISLVIVTHAHRDHIGCLPALVAEGRIAVEWALVADPDGRWGGAAPDADSRISTFARALMEEVLPPDAPPSAIRQLIADAASLEDNYRDMLKRLKKAGTRVVRHGPGQLKPLLKRFAGIGLQVFGPSDKQLAACAALMQTREDGMRAIAADLAADGMDDIDDLVARYRDVVTAISADADVEADFSKDKGAINDTSLIVGFALDGRKILMTGDHQLVEPEVSDDVVVREIAALRRKIAKAGPWDLMKLSHHGSYNGFDRELWEQVGRPALLGLCAGSNSTHHPSTKVLSVLEGLDDVKWARTDRNGLTTFTWTATGADIAPARGELNDPDPNSADAEEGRPIVPAPGEAPAPPPPPPAIAPTVTTTTAGSHGFVEVTAKIPLGAGRITISVDVGADGMGGSDAPRPLAPALGRARLELASGRDLPRLLFVTSRAALGRNIGHAEADHVLDVLRARHVLVDDLPAGLTTAQPAVARVRQRLSDDASIEGVVVLGGYDVIPPQVLDTLPPRLRARYASSSDRDGFIVWSDDGFGDLNADKFPERPVSRIPDGLSAELVFNALGTPLCASGRKRAGIRNHAREFADVIYDRLPGDGAMLLSRPQAYDAPTYSIAAERIYIMLHGMDHDGTRFWGEDGADYVTAVTPSNIPESPGCVVFTGCCWGALAGDPRASRARPGQALLPRTPASSIALKFLQSGARAFVGCTGVHYSDEDGSSAGGPMHRAFWRHLDEGLAPAAALLAAKKQYWDELPHPGIPRGSLGEAIEFKIWRQYTCLGLGW